MDSAGPPLAGHRLQGPPPAWVTYSPLLPLFLLMFSGLYMFVLPYATKWRGGASQQAGD
jgi:hypothetical protein